METLEPISVEAGKDARGRWCVIVTVTGEAYPPILCRNEIHALEEVRRWEERLRCRAEVPPGH